MEEKRNIPHLRFPGFTDDWEQRKFGEVTVLKSASRVHKEEWTTSGVPFYRSSDVMAALNGTDNTKAFISEELYEKLSAVSGKLEQGDILVTGGGSVGNPYKVPNNEPLYTKDADLLWVKRSERLNPDFVYQFFLSPAFRGYLSSISHVGTIAHYTITQLENTPIALPSVEEQRRIGAFLTNIDAAIALHQRKLDVIKQYKAGMLQKMFPKDGKKVPEVRFPGFTDDWEQRKLGELLEASNERNNEGRYTQDNVLAASLGTELEEKHIFFGLRSTEESVKNYRVVKPGDVIYTKSPIKGYPHGIVRTSKGKEGIVPSLYCVYNSDSSINPSFIQSYLEDKGRLDFYLNPLVNIGARNNVNITDAGFLEGSILMPQDVEEQSKIVALLDKLTNLITLHQRKLDQVKLYKQGLLQQMFV